MATAAAQTVILLSIALLAPLNTFFLTATGLKDATGWAAARTELEHADFCCNMVISISEVVSTRLASFIPHVAVHAFRQCLGGRR